eukprot:CAMPEP_0194213590 /NCGR_PEP_ID=MMETSP0156-20130528/14298_1 /TAXON_ID=33649 /ORGANISM="Thalassionema nitzschioides, Strain L26-B" /LENGTH=229 /DNA_ID=CAMNT_0038941659 /DNA_START=241 /DNA_END=930 /DNA_ORIENTATION=-
MESFESKRIAGQEEDNLLEKETKNEHQTSLFHLGSTEYITPISFEDGMDWRECEMYYTALYEGMIDLRSSVHIRRTSKIRKPSKMQLQQQASGIKPSCLRSQTTKHKPLRPPMRRSVSFNTLPKDNALYASHLGDTMQDLFKEPRVNFDDYVSVMTILPRQDYPLDVRNDIWMSKDESEKCLCDAMTERSCQNASSAPIKHNVESIDSGNASVKLTVGLDQDLSLISFQ